MFYPADKPINCVTVLANGEYPYAFRSTITLDDSLAKYSKNNVLTYAHEMVHAVDQSYGATLPSPWMEGRAEYISRKVCDELKTSYNKYKAKYNWSFLTEEDKADFCRYYFESTNRETEYAVGYYFFKYLCDTYGEDVSVRIMENFFKAVPFIGADSIPNMSMETFRQCIEDATEPGVFQNFVRDVVDQK